MAATTERPNRGRRQASVAHRPPSGTGNPDIEWSTAWVAARTGATFRQLDFWIRKGLVSRDLEGLGSGARRRFTPADLEIVHALVHLAALGVRDRWMVVAIETVRARPVAAGERLVLLLDGTCYRLAAHAPVDTAGPGWIVPLHPHGARS